MPEVLASLSALLWMFNMKSERHSPILGGENNESCFFELLAMSVFKEVPTQAGSNEPGAAF